MREKVDGLTRHNVASCLQVILLYSTFSIFLYSGYTPVVSHISYQAIDLGSNPISLLS